MSPNMLSILIVVLLVFILFGAGRLPRMMEDIAKGIKSFKKGLNEEDTPSEVKSDDKDKKEK